MKRNGFVFVETIIVVTVLATALLSVYAAFTTVLINEKRRVMFDDPAYIYRTYYLEDFLVSLNLDSYINTHLGSDKQKIIEFSCDNSLFNLTDDQGIEIYEEKEKKAFCEMIINEYSTLNIKHIFITFYDVKDLKECTSKTGKLSDSDKCKSYSDALKNINVNMIYYIRTLSGSSQGYRIIVEYEETDTDYTSKKSPNEGNCGSNYILKNNMCYKKIKKSYYNSVKLVVRGETS